MHFQNYELRLKNRKTIAISHLNINSARNKFTSFKELISRNIDICLLSEIKIDETFTNTQFEIEGYKIFRKDENKHGGGSMFYINENIAEK